MELNPGWEAMDTLLSLQKMCKTQCSFYFAAWAHCSTCDKCALPSHSCKDTDVGCFICGAADHKRTTCPNLHVARRSYQSGKKTKQKKLKGNMKIKGAKKTRTATQTKNKK
ncbi:hypothetical protein JD844_027267 [Phrynosoma platyrhinos]|uniref:Uncharacterized protein n=1 Tax=Phrynosoma platyrhinos TaxID=52577 RepID=A0ABQ7SG27_PHRPL|nr:hypothetical protein JD844_027267 [Phrynosoma platyrhinos]